MILVAVDLQIAASIRHPEACSATVAPEQQAVAAAAAAPADRNPLLYEWGDDIV